jgi:hypothetical protein
MVAERVPHGRLFRLALLAAFAGALPAHAAPPQSPFSYSHLDLEYELDATVELNGGSYDADEGHGVAASYLLFPSAYLWGRYADADHDLAGADDLWLRSYGVGLGYRHRLFAPGIPVDVNVAAGYEHQRTRHEVSAVTLEDSYDGGSLQVGIRAAVTPSLEIDLSALQLVYGSNPFRRNQKLDGLFFSVGGVLAIAPSLQLTLRYVTGELDYVLFPDTPDQPELELDRDAVRLGVRWVW